MSRFICLLLVLYPLLSPAQEKKLEIEIGSASNSPAYTFVNRERTRVCLLVIRTGEIRGFIINNEYKTEKEFTIMKQPVTQVLTGGYFEGDKVHFFLAREDNDDNLHHYTFDPATGTHRYVSTDLQIKKSMFLGALSEGDQFLFVCVKKKEDKISVYRFGRKQEHELLEFSLPAASLGSESLRYALTKEAGFSRESEVATIHDWEEPSIDQARLYGKMYFRNDSLLITLDKSIFATKVLSLDLDKQAIGLREIRRTFDPCSDAPISGQSHSSILVGRYLYAVQTCNDALQLMVHDFYDGRILKHYVTTKDDEITYRSTPILQEGSTYFSGEERKLEKTRQLLRKMSSGRALIIARSPATGEVELTIGSYATIRSGGGGTWMHGMPGSAPTYMPGGFTREWTKSARFKTILSTATFEKTQREIDKPLDEKIDIYTRGIKIPVGSEGVFPMNGRLSYYYIDRRQKKIVISVL